MQPVKKITYNSKLIQDFAAKEKKLESQSNLFTAHIKDPKKQGISILFKLLQQGVPLYQENIDYINEQYPDLQSGIFSSECRNLISQIPLIKGLTPPAHKSQIEEMIKSPNATYDFGSFIQVEQQPPLLNKSFLINNISMLDLPSELIFKIFENIPSTTDLRNFLSVNKQSHPYIHEIVVMRLKNLGDFFDPIIKMIPDNFPLKTKEKKFYYFLLQTLLWLKNKKGDSKNLKILLKKSYKNNYYAVFAFLFDIIKNNSTINNFNNVLLYAAAKNSTNFIDFLFQRENKIVIDKIIGMKNRTFYFDEKNKKITLLPTHSIKHFIYSCMENELEVVKFIFNEFKSHLDHQTLKNGFSQACEKGNLEIVRFLFDQVKFENYIVEKAFESASLNNQEKTMKFLKKNFISSKNTNEF